MQAADVDKLIKIGVCDSKQLSDKQIVPIAKKLYADYQNRSQSLILKPAKYNEIYASFVSQKKNLNDLLAWQHGKNIENLLKLHPEAQGVLIDQFSPSKKASSQVRKSFPDIQIVERPGAEADLAVAAASIMARYQLINAFESMGNFYQMKFQKGAGAGVKTIARAFVAQYGKDRLGEVAKLHFKTTLEL
jgi:ribonuclease HIII